MNYMKFRMTIRMPQISDYLADATPDEKEEILDLYYTYVKSGETRGPDMMTIEFNMSEKTAKIVKNERKSKYNR